MTLVNRRAPRSVVAGAPIQPPITTELHTASRNLAIRPPQRAFIQMQLG